MERILILAPAWVGDAVIAQVLYRILKQQQPDCQLSVMAPAWSQPLLARMPEVDQILANPFGRGTLQLGARWRLGRSLRGQFDRALVLPMTWKIALIPWAAGIARRTGYLGEQRYGLLNDLRPLDPRQLPRMVDRYRALAFPPKALETRQSPDPATLPTPVLRVDPVQQQASLQRLKLVIDRPVLALCPGAEYGPAKRWPARHYIALAQQWQRKGYQIWLLGSAHDRPVTQGIAQAVPQAIDLAGRTALGEAIDLLACAQAVVCNDSGLMHIAAALRRPLVAVFGSSSPGYTPPLAPEFAARIVRLGLPCSPCFKKNCPLSHLDCLEKLHPERVHQALEAVLHLPMGTVHEAYPSSTSPSAPARRSVGGHPAAG